MPPARTFLRGERCRRTMAAFRRKTMAGELIAGLLLILGAAIWRGISLWRNAPEEKHSVAEYADALFFRDDREAKR